jgi:hypothetical protein
MRGKAVILVVAGLGWLVASLIAFVLVAKFTFFGIGLIGLFLWFICTRIELEKDGAVGGGWTPELIRSQYEARQRMSYEQRAADRDEQTLAMQSTRFFRHLGMALTAIGVVGFAVFQI